MKKLIIFLCILLVSCKTTENISPAPTPIPCALTKTDTKTVIMLSLSDVQNTKLSPGQERADQLLDHFLGERYSRDQYWFYEGSGRDIVYAAYHYKNYYMRVEIKYSNTDIIYKIVDSKNLKQSGNVIHKSVFVWLGKLDRMIRANLGRYERAHQKATGTLCQW